MTLGTGKCKSCGAELLWAHTAAGAHVPLDAKPERRYVETGEADQVVLVETYLTHFVTCPNADEHRRPRS